MLRRVVAVYPSFFHFVSEIADNTCSHKSFWIYLNCINVLANSAGFEPAPLYLEGRYSIYISLNDFNDLDKNIIKSSSPFVYKYTLP